MKADKQSTANYLSTLVSNGIISRNEARKYLGYQDIEGGDEITVSYTDISQNTVNGKQEDSSEDEDK